MQKSWSKTLFKKWYLSSYQGTYFLGINKFLLGINISPTKVAPRKSRLKKKKFEVEVESMNLARESPISIRKTRKTSRKTVERRVERNKIDHLYNKKKIIYVYKWSTSASFRARKISRKSHLKTKQVERRVESYILARDGTFDCRYFDFDSRNRKIFFSPSRNVDA